MIEVLPFWRLSTWATLERREGAVAVHTESTVQHQPLVFVEHEPGIACELDRLVATGGHRTGRDELEAGAHHSWLATGRRFVTRLQRACSAPL